MDYFLLIKNRGDSFDMLFLHFCRLSVVETNDYNDNDDDECFSLTELVCVVEHVHAKLQHYREVYVCMF